MQELRQSFDIAVVSIIKLDDLIGIMEESSQYEAHLEPMLEYRKKYGVVT